MFGLSMQEVLIIGVVAVLLFGKRLPEVARSMGKSYNEFRRGLSDVHSEMNSAMNADAYSSKSHAAADSYDDSDDYDEATAPKFEPPSNAPVDESLDSDSV